MERTIGLETVFVALLLAHLLGDFVFQSRSVVEGKERFRARAYLLHGVYHYLLAVLLLQPYVTSRPFGGWTLQVLLLGLGAVHAAIDFGKLRLRERGASVGAFLADQAAHVATLAAAAALIAPIRIAAYDPSRLDRWVESATAPLAVVVATVFGAGWLIRLLLAPLEPGSTEEGRVELSNAGLYIGWLERLLVLFAVVARSPEAVGFIVAAKSIVRFPSLDHRPFAEYFLIGTLLSVIVAVAGGMVLLWMGLRIG